jgi:hypothetical protein
MYFHAFLAYFCNYVINILINIKLGYEDFTRNFENDLYSSYHKLMLPNVF